MKKKKKKHEPTNTKKKTKKEKPKKMDLIILSISTLNRVFADTTVAIKVMVTYDIIFVLLSYGAVLWSTQDEWYYAAMRMSAGKNE